MPTLVGEQTAGRARLPPGGVLCQATSAPGPCRSGAPGSRQGRNRCLPTHPASKSVPGALRRWAPAAPRGSRIPLPPQSGMLGHCASCLSTRATSTTGAPMTCSCRGVSCTVALQTSCKLASVRSSVPAGKLTRMKPRTRSLNSPVSYLRNTVVGMPCCNTKDADAAWQAKPCTSVPKTALQCSCAVGGPPQHKCSSNVRASR